MNLYRNNLGSNYVNSLENCFENFVLKSVYGQDYQKNLLGIINNGSTYHKINSNQDLTVEYIKTLDFLKSLHGLDCVYMDANTKIMFINYGDTELVYIIDDGSDKYTLLVGQPNLEFGKVNEEYWNLIELGKLSNKVVVPLEYITNGVREAFVTPYIYQARCIASDKKWGMYIPEPFYRFVPFTKEQESIVNQCMIAKLVSFYDFENNEGIASCKLGGGDFMLPKGWELEQPTIQNTLNSLYFIAARKKVKCSFDEYTATIIDEFSRKTIDDDENRLIINKRGRVRMEINDILNGIRLGKEIIKDRDGYTLKKN